MLLGKTKKPTIHTLGMQRGNSLHHEHAQKRISKDLYMYIILPKGMQAKGKREKKKNLLCDDACATKTNLYCGDSLVLGLCGHVV